MALKPQPAPSFSKQPAHHDGYATLHAYDQEDESPFHLALVKGYSISLRNRTEAFLILPCTMLQGENLGKNMGALLPIQPSESTSVLTEISGAPITFAHSHLEFSFCTGERLRIAETLPHPTMLLVKQGVTQQKWATVTTLRSKSVAAQRFCLKGEAGYTHRDLQGPPPRPWTECTQFKSKFVLLNKGDFGCKTIRKMPILV